MDEPYRIVRNVRPRTIEIVCSADKRSRMCNVDRELYSRTLGKLYVSSDGTRLEWHHPIRRKS